MTDAHRAAAQDLLDALLWETQDGLGMRRIPKFDYFEPPDDPNLGPGYAFEVLADLYPPARLLPEPGQSLYRDLQGMIDLRVADPHKTNHTPAADMVAFLKTLDALARWLVAEYGLADLPSSEAPAGVPKRPRPDPADDRRRLTALLVERHAADNPRKDEPFTQAELAERLGWPQPRVSRRMAAMFPGGWDDYLARFAAGKPRGYRKADGDGGSDVEGVFVPGEDD